MGAALVAEAIALFHAEFTAGAPADTAAKNVLTALEAKLQNPVVKGVVTAVLDALVKGIEAAAAAA